MKRYIVTFMLMISMLLIPAISFSHSGRTDSSGGHYNRSTGEYHYHHGYSAHQHSNGVCPYEENKNNFYEEEGFTGIFDDSTEKTDTVSSFERIGEAEYSVLENTVKNLSNKNKDLENQIDTKQTRINELTNENNNLKEQIDTLYYISIGIVIVGILYIYHLLKKINILESRKK